MIPTDYLPIAIEDRLDSATFDELAELVSSKIRSAGAHAVATLENMISAGGALCQMRDRTPGRYVQWLTDQGIDGAYARKLQRLHTYRHELAELSELPANVTRAVAAIRHLPRIYSPGYLEAIVGKSTPGNAGKRDRALRLIAAGTPMREAAAIVEVPYSTVRNWNAGPAQRRREKDRENKKQADRRTLDRDRELEARKDIVARSSPSLAGAYEHVRKALVALASGKRSASVNNAEQYLTAAENAIVRAMREERAS